MPIMTHKELSDELNEYIERRKNGPYLTKENLKFALKSTNYAFFAPYNSGFGFAAGLVAPLVIAPLFTLAAAIAVINAIYHVMKAIFSTSEANKELKKAAEGIPVVFALAILTPLSQPLALLALVTSSIATALSKNKTENEAQTKDCFAPCS